MVCFPKHFYQNCKWFIVVRTPLVFLLMVQALPISLATTLGIIFYFLFLWVLRCFSSPRSLLTYYFTHMQILRFFSLSEFPHSDIYESMDICSSSQLFAAYHVLLRLLVPRHSPYALCSLTYFIFGFIVNKFSMFNIVSLSFLAFFFYQFTYFSLYIFQCAFDYLPFLDNLVVGSNGIEPSTSRLSGVRSNHLSYEPIFQSFLSSSSIFCELHSQIQCTC